MTKTLEGHVFPMVCREIITFLISEQLTDRLESHVIVGKQC